MFPFHAVHWRHSGASGVRQNADGRASGSTPLEPYTANTLTRVGDVELGEHGQATGTFHFNMSGQDALNWRQIALENDPDEVKKQFDNWLSSIAPDGIHAQLDQ